MDHVARARAHASKGNTGAAIALLKPLVGTEQPPYAARRALAETYRDIGAPDQAGRWGIALDGWTTPLERDRLARMLAFYPDPRRLLSLPEIGADPVDLAEVLALRTAYNDRAAERHRRAIEESKATPEGRALQREEAIWATAIVLVAIAVVGPSLVVFGSLLLDQQSLAAWAAAVGWGLAAIASFLIAVAGWIGERRLRLGWTFWASLVMAAVAAGHGVLAASWSTS